MKINYVLVDYENVKVADIAQLSDERFRVTLFLGLHDTKLPTDLVLAMQRLGERGSYVVLDAVGRNALDFYIAYYLGTLATRDHGAFFHIVSKDTGFDPLISHVKAQGIRCKRSESVDDLSCFIKESATSPSAREQVAVRQSVALPATEEPVIVRQLVASAPARTIDQLVRIAVEDLIRRKTSRPSKEQTLRNTIQATCGKQLKPGQIDKVIKELVARGWVKLTGVAVTYDLPKQLSTTKG